MTVSLIPTVLWAQRKDKLFVTIDLQDCKDPEVKLENDDGSGRIIFKGKAGKDEADYAFDMSLLGSIDPEASKVNVNARNVILIVEKKESGDHWPRLLKERGKEPHIKVDWAKYIDQDEEEAGQDTFDFNSLPGEFSGLDMGAGLGGMGEEISDSDDEAEAEQVEPAA